MSLFFIIKCWSIEEWVQLCLAVAKCGVTNDMMSGMIYAEDTKDSGNKSGSPFSYLRLVLYNFKYEAVFW